ncbi:hypothetical protein SGRIM119S_02789 [Streptomyces griseorubiginosus]
MSTGEDDPPTRSAGARAASRRQSSIVPRDRSSTAMPWPSVRVVRQRRSHGSVPPDSTIPGPVVPVTVTSSRVVRAALLRWTPVLVSCTAVRTTRVVQWSSRAIAGLSVEEMSQSSTEPRASPFARTPLPRASRTVQPRRVTRPRSPITAPEVPRCSTVHDSTELSTGEVTTRPAPCGLVTRQSRMASEPVPRASSAVQPAPVTSQPSRASWPRATSTTGNSSSRPVRTRSVSITASAFSTTALPRRGAISTLPRACSATIVTRVPITRPSW